MTVLARRRMSTTAVVYVALAVIIAVGAVLAATEGKNLFSTGNLVEMLTRSSLLGFIAIGQTIVVLCRSLDLSVGYVAALTSIIAATTMDGDPGRMLVGVAAALGAATVVGLVNGLLVTVGKVNPFIATLGVGLMLKGYLDTEYAGPAGDVPEAFRAFGYTRIGPIPLSTLVMLGVAAAAVVALTRTRFGHHVYATGGDVDVARASGVRTGRTLIVAHVLCALAAGLAGVLLASRFGTGSALVYSSGYDLESIAAVVLGGTYLMGGRGGVAGTVGGVLILATLDTVFNIFQVDPFVKDVLRGTVIIVAVALYARRSLSARPRRARFGSGSAPPPLEPVPPGPAPDPETGSDAGPEPAPEPTTAAGGTS